MRGNKCMKGVEGATFIVMRQAGRCGRPLRGARACACACALCLPDTPRIGLPREKCG